MNFSTYFSLLIPFVFPLCMRSSDENEPKFYTFYLYNDDFGIAETVTCSPKTTVFFDTLKRMVHYNNNASTVGYRLKIDGSDVGSVSKSISCCKNIMTLASGLLDTINTINWGNVDFEEHVRLIGYLNANEKITKAFFWRIVKYQPVTVMSVLEPYLLNKDALCLSGKNEKYILDQCQLPYIVDLSIDDTKKLYCEALSSISVADKKILQKKWYTVQYTNKEFKHAWACARLACSLAQYDSLELQSALDAWESSFERMRYKAMANTPHYFNGNVEKNCTTILEKNNYDIVCGLSRNDFKIIFTKKVQDPEYLHIPLIALASYIYLHNKHQTLISEKALDTFVFCGHTDSTLWHGTYVHDIDTEYLNIICKFFKGSTVDIKMHPDAKQNVVPLFKNFDAGDSHIIQIKSEEALSDEAVCLVRPISYRSICSAMCNKSIFLLKNVLPWLLFRGARTGVLGCVAWYANKQCTSIKNQAFALYNTIPETTKSVMSEFINLRMGYKPGWSNMPFPSFHGDISAISADTIINAYQKLIQLVDLYNNAPLLLTLSGIFGGSYLDWCCIYYVCLAFCGLSIMSNLYTIKELFSTNTPATLSKNTNLYYIDQDRAYKIPTWKRWLMNSSIKKDCTIFIFPTTKQS